MPKVDISDDIARMRALRLRSELGYLPYHPKSPNKTGRGLEGMHNAFATFCAVCDAFVPLGYAQGTFWHGPSRQYLCFDHFSAMIEIDDILRTV